MDYQFDFYAPAPKPTVESNVMRAVAGFLEHSGVKVCEWHGTLKTLVGLNERGRQWSVTLGEYCVINQGYTIGKGPSEFDGADLTRLEMADPELLTKILAAVRASDVYVSYGRMEDMMDGRLLWDKRLAEFAAEAKSTIWPS